MYLTGGLSPVWWQNPFKLSNRWLTLVSVQGIIRRFPLF
ncbi:hypothetical protein F652_2662 [Enterobacteriaceae bacterium bta3-1]|nr:hypothetical protein F652_2662 [Enterobacteriaceae bacterium bta3-1]